MIYTYTFYSEPDEVPSHCWDGNIIYRKVYNDYCIKVDMDFDDNINFDFGIIGEGYDTKHIKSYEDLLKFIEEHYDEIQDDDDNMYNAPTNRDCIDELIAICKEKINK